MTELETLQLRAFDEARAQLPPDKGILSCGGRAAVVVPMEVQHTRLLREAGYDPSQSTTIDIKRTDFDRLKITHKSDVMLDGRGPLRPIDINDDLTDAIVNITLGPRR